MVRASKTFFAALLIACALFAGCAELKQWAYEGFNRDRWQQPEKVIAALQLRPGDHIADLGAGGGYFTFRLATAVGPAGKVLAVDVDREMTDLIAQRAKTDGVKNIEPILAKHDDPLLPKAGIDLIFTSNTYHHIDNRGAYFKNLQTFLRPGGRIAIIDFDGRAWFESWFGHSSPSDAIKREMEAAGYALLQEHDFLERQSFSIFAVKP
jgi:ubiquinone/menaquinone biosynthesis C-methylase UbiE